MTATRSPTRAYRSRLDPDQLQSLYTGLLADLRSSDAQKQRTAASPVAGAAVTKVSMWSPTGVLDVHRRGTRRAQDPSMSTPTRYYDARDRLAAMHKTVSATAQPYLADRVRLVAMPVDGEPAT